MFPPFPRSFIFLKKFFKQKTAYEMESRDWSSDVCSSDLGKAHGDIHGQERLAAARIERGHDDDIRCLILASHERCV